MAGNGESDSAASIILIENKERDKDLQSGWVSASIMDVPEPIFIDSILLKLPIKEIIMMKCSCKSWRRLISDPRFARLHFKLAEPCLLLRVLDSSCVPRKFYLVESSKSDAKYCKGHDSNIKLETKLKIPLRNPVTACKIYNAANANRGWKRKRCVKLRLTDHKFKVVNSCNGLLCLSELTVNDPAIVCNPVTGEYINLPDGELTSGDYVDCGLGFNPKTDQYKVIRIFDDKTQASVPCPLSGRRMYDTSKVAEVLTLGTQTWRCVGYAPQYYSKLSQPFYFNGALHWFRSESFSSCILAFDLEQECFQEVPEPPSLWSKFSHSDIPNLSMGILRGCLSVCDASYRGPALKVWVMEKYGVEESWTPILSIYNGYLDRLPNEHYQPITYLKCGALLMFHRPKTALLHYDPESKEKTFLKICGAKWKCEAVSYFPSLISLKDAIGGSDARILNINTTCGRIKIQGENKVLCLVEEEMKQYLSE